jgi:hypothetical protein
LVGSKSAVQLLEAASAIGRFGDHADHADMRRSVSRRLKQDGLRLPRGKRTKPGLEELVDALVPLLLYCNIPLASGERSRLVSALRLIANELNVPGDPRDELRRKIRIEREISSQQLELAKQMFARAFAMAFSDEVSTVQKK